MLRSYKSIPGVDSPLNKGSQVMIPRFIAERLEMQGIVETYDNTISQQDLAKAKFSHIQQKGSIPKVDEFFYMKVKSTINKLLSKAKSEGDIILLRNIEKMREDFMDVFNMRISAIFRAFQLGGVDIVDRNCTLEEKTLVNTIKSFYSKWFKEYTEIGRG